TRQHLAGARPRTCRAAAVRMGARLHRHPLLAQLGALVRAGAANPVRPGRRPAGDGAGGLLGGRAARGGAQCRTPGALERLQVATRAPDAAMGARLVTLRDRLQHTFLALLGLALLVPVVRIVRRATGARVEVTYRGGPTVRVAPGQTLLELSSQ